MANQIAIFRRKLRHQILDEFGDANADEIYNAVKNPDHPQLYLQDLAPFCAAANIPEEMLPDIFDAYRKYTGEGMKKKFESFLGDEVTAKSGRTAVPASVTSAQRAILDEFVEAIRLHKARSGAVTDPRSELFKVSAAWGHVVEKNAPGSDPKFVRIAALVKLVDGYRLKVSLEDFVEAIFAFFEQRLDQLDFTQFTALIDAFS